MIISSIIPIWVMVIICIILIIVVVKNKVNIVRRVAVICLLFVINLRPMIASGNAKIASSNLNILFVIDNTISMMANDSEGGSTRIEAVKKDCEYILNSLTGAKYSVITFGNESQVLTPFTKDSTMTSQAINTIKITNRYYAMGSTPNIVYDDMLDMLKTSKQSENRKTIVFFFSDGEITNNEKLKSFSELKNYIDSGAVLGYGTEEGANMLVQDFYDETPVYIEDYTSNETPYPKAVSKIDEVTLKNLANDMGISYVNMSKNSNITKTINDIKNNYEDKAGVENIWSYTDIYYIFVIPLLVLLILELIDYRKKL